MTPVAQRRDAQPLWPVAVVILASSCFQLGAVSGKALFPMVGAPGATAMRLTLSALILAALARPWRGPFTRQDLAPTLLYGLALAGLNAFFFLALRTIPLGIAVAIDFIGPLGVAVAHSRRVMDVAWVAMAGLGIVLLMPIGAGAAPLDPVGLMFCGATAMSWAGYIVCGRVAGRRLSSSRATALGVAVAAVVVLPFGVAGAGATLISPAVLPLGVAVAVLSSALPNTLEMVAMTRLPPRVFGVLMSLEPVLGALFGWLLLGEHLTVPQMAAIALIIAASAGATLTATRPVPITDG